MLSAKGVAFSAVLCLSFSLKMSPGSDKPAATATSTLISLAAAGLEVASRISSSSSFYAQLAAAAAASSSLFICKESWLVM